MSYKHDKVNHKQVPGTADKITSKDINFPHYLAARKKYIKDILTSSSSPPKGGDIKVFSQSNNFSLVVLSLLFRFGLQKEV